MMDVKLYIRLACNMLPALREFDTLAPYKKEEVVSMMVDRLMDLKVAAKEEGLYEPEAEAGRGETVEDVQA